MKQVLTGNEAFARGAYEAGVKVAAAYPGTPSTEILVSSVILKVLKNQSLARLENLSGDSG